MVKFNFNKNYFIGFVFLFLIESLIAIYLKKGFIRHTFGDVLVVILLYCFIKSFFNLKPIYVVLGVLIFAFIIEFLQLSPLLELLNLQNNHIAKLVLGSTFQISDLVAYCFGAITILLFENIITKKE